MFYSPIERQSLSTFVATTNKRHLMKTSKIIKRVFWEKKFVPTNSPFMVFFFFFFEIHRLDKFTNLLIILRAYGYDIEHERGNCRWDPFSKLNSCKSTSVVFPHR